MEILTCKVKTFLSPWSSFIQANQQQWLEFGPEDLHFESFPACWEQKLFDLLKRLVFEALGMKNEPVEVTQGSVHLCDDGRSHTGGEVCVCVCVYLFVVTKCADRSTGKCGEVGGFAGYMLFSPQIIFVKSRRSLLFTKVSLVYVWV